MSIQQKEARSIESFNFREESPHKHRLNTTFFATETETKSSVLNRINTQQTESRALSPPIPSHLNGGISKVATTSPNRLFYSQVYGKQEQGLTVFYNELSPGQINRKPIEQLEYQNGVLLQQLQERDQIIHMYKSGWTPQSYPINDELVRTLNLQIAQKNVLIEQIHRSLAQFQETVKRQNLQLSAICIQQFNQLQTLIIRHQHYPILITQRLIQTSKHAQTIYIKDTTIIQEYMFKLEQSYKQVTILREKIIWFQKEHHNLEVTIANLRGQLEQTQYQNAIYVQEINTLRTQLQQFQGMNQGQISQYQAQINTLKQRIAQLEAHGAGSGNQIATLKQQINIFITQINSYKQQINVYITQINNYKVQIGALQNQLNGFRHQGGQTSVLHNEIAKLKQQINIYITQINNFKQEINVYQNEIANWRAQFTNIQNENGALKQQINVYITQINNYRIQIQNLSIQVNGLRNSGGSQRNISEIESYKQQITMLQAQIQNIRRQGSKRIDCGHANEINSYKQQITSLTFTIQQDTTRYTQEIERLNKEISRLKLQSSTSTSYDFEIQSLRQKIFSYEQEISTLNRKIGSQFDIQWELDSLKRENQRLKNDTSKLKKQNYQLEEQINKLNQEIIKLKGRISRLESQSSNEVFEWRTKYEESQTIIRKLRIQIEQYSFNINTNTNSGNNEWKLQYEALEIKYKYLQDQIEYYKLEYQNIQNRLNAQEKTLREELEGQFNYKIQLLEERLRIQIRQQLQITIQTEIENNLRIKWEVKLNESYENLKQAEQYINTLLAKIKELESTIEILNKQITILQNRPTTFIDISTYQRRIIELELQLERFKNESEQYKKQIYDADQYILQLQEELKNRPGGDDTTSFSITIEELTVQIKELLIQINELTRERDQYDHRYKQIEQIYSTSKNDFELTIRRFNQQIEALKKELADRIDGNKEWEREKKELVEKYERELKERWDQLKISEEYIANYTKQSQEIIAYLEQRVKELQSLLEKQVDSGRGQYLYQIDARYEEIRKRLLLISTQTTQSITAESEYWQSYKLKRRQQIQTIQQTINQSLSYMNQIQQTIVVKRQELHRLDFTKLDTILRELENLQRGKGDLDAATREEFETRFYGVVKTVSTAISQ